MTRSRTITQLSHPGGPQSLQCVFSKEKTATFISRSSYLCVRMDTCVHTHTCLHIRTHIRVCVYICICIHTRARAHTHTDAHRNTYTHTHTHTYTHTHTHTQTPCKLSQMVFSVETQSQEGGISTMFKMNGKRRPRMYQYVP